MWPFVGGIFPNGLWVFAGYCILSRSLIFLNKFIINRIANIETIDEPEKFSFKSFNIPKSKKKVIKPETKASL